MKVEINKLDGMAKVASGYLYDTATDNVTSSRQIGSGSLLMGSFSTGVRRYTFMLKSQYKTAYRTNVSINANDLRTKARNYVSTAGANKEVAVPFATTVTASKAGLGLEKGWIIGTMDNGKLSVAETPKVHGSENSVIVEMVRLAKLYPNRVFVKMNVTAFVQAGGVSWF